MKKAHNISNRIIIVLLLSFVFVIIKVYFAKNQTEIDCEYMLIEKTKEIINEKNFFAKDETQTLLWGYSVRYDIYSDKNNYYVVLPDESNIVFAFTQYDNNLYYIDYGKYDKAPKLCSGSFLIDNIHKPDYITNDNARVTRFLDSETILSSVISNYEYDEFYTVYLLNSFPWDKSNYLNGSEMVDIMIIDKDKNVFVTYCYFSANGWNVGTPGFKFHQDDYPELVKKYKDTAVCSKSAVNNIINGNTD